MVSCWSISDGSPFNLSPSWNVFRHLKLAMPRETAGRCCRTKGWRSMFRFGIRFYGQYCWCHGVLWWMTPMMKKYSSSTIGWGIPRDDCLFLHFLRSHNPSTFPWHLCLQPVEPMEYCFLGVFYIKVFPQLLHLESLNREGDIWKLYLFGFTEQK